MGFDEVVDRWRLVVGARPEQPGKQEHHGQRTGQQDRQPDRQQVEHVQRRHAVADHEAVDQQVGGRAHQRQHAAEGGGIAHRQQQSRRGMRAVGTQRTDQRGDHRGVVQHRRVQAGRGDQLDQGKPVAAPHQPGGQHLEQARLVEHHRHQHQGQDRHQPGVRELPEHLGQRHVAQQHEDEGHPGEEHGGRLPAAHQQYHQHGERRADDDLLAGHVGISPRPRRCSMTRSAAWSGVVSTVLMRSSGASGSSYGESMPVKLASSPLRAFLYSPLTSRCSAISSGVSTWISMNSPFSSRLRARSPLGAERRDEGCQDDQAGVDHQPGHFGHAADVLDAVGFGEAQVLVQAVAHVVAVQQVGVASGGVELLLDQVGDRGLAGAGQTGEPEHRRLLAEQRGSGGLVHVEVLQVDVVRAPQREMQHAGADRVVAHAVDDDESAGVAVAHIRIEGDALVERDVAHADLVEIELLGRQVLHRVDVDLVLRLGDRDPDGARAQLEQVGTPRQHRLVGHPHQGALELVGHLGRVLGGGNHVAAGDVHLVLEGQHHRLPGDCLDPVAFVGHDARHAGLAPGGLHANAVARAHAARGDQAAETAEIQVRPVHPLHRQSQRAGLQPRLVDVGGLEEPHQRRPVVPGRAVARVNDVVAAQAGDRNRRDVGQPDAGGEPAVVVVDLPVRGLVVADEVHLVDRQDHLADPDQRHQVAVAAGLREDALARVDQDHGHVGRGGPGDHVARVLLVTGGVGDDELPALGAEEAVRHVDRDALLTLGSQPVDEQREVDLAALGAPLAGIGLDGGDLVVEQHLRLEQQASDQGALPVVDRTAGDEAQQALGLVLGQVGLDVGGDEVGDVCHQDS